MQDSLQLKPEELVALGYRDLSYFNETEAFNIYRAHTHDGQAVFIKIPASNNPSVAVTRQLEHELEVASDLNPNYILRPVKIERVANHTVLILEGCNFPLLASLFQKPIGIEVFLPITIGLASAVSEVHRHGLVHNAIRPENIYAQTTGEVKLTGFGVASRLLRQPQPIESPELGADESTSVTPEQTGFINSSINTYSDLYALGVLFYQMLTGRLPFTAFDLIDTGHGNIPIQSEPANDHLRTIPLSIFDIVMRLLSKTAEECYHSAAGLLADLQYCMDEWSAHGQIQAFPLRRFDIPSQQLICKVPLPAGEPKNGSGNQLDLAAVAKAMQTVSGENALTNLIETLISNVIEFMGAQRGLMILPSDQGFEVVVEIEVKDADFEVKPGPASIAATACAQVVINRVTRTLERIIIDTASHAETFVDDPYLSLGVVKSLLCYPLIRQSKLVGLIYLENSQTTGAFTQERVVVLDILAAQAVIALENAALCNELRENQVKFNALAQKIDSAVIVHDAETKVLSANGMAQDLFGLSESQLLGKRSSDLSWHFLREDGSVMPMHEYPVNRVLTSHSALQNQVIGVAQPGREVPVWVLVNAIPVADETNRIIQVVVSFTDISERKKAEQQLAASEQLFRTLVENSPDHIARYDLNLRRIYLNPAVEKLFKAPHDSILGKTSRVASPLIDPDRYMDNLRRAMETGQEVSDEIAFRTPQDEIHWASSRFAPEFDLDGKVQSVLVISNDTTEQKRAELERMEYTHFLESLDRCNRALQEADSIEQMLSRTLDEVLDIFDCDRAYLLYPCDPNATEWRLPMARCKPGYSWPLSSEKTLPYSPHIADTLRALLNSDTPICAGPDMALSIPREITERLGVRSMMAISVHPKVDLPWQFCIQQCSHERIWSEQEARLFEEIGHRLSDGLNDLLVMRNLRESEERFRLVYENSPVPIWEGDFSTVKSHLEELKEHPGGDLASYLMAHPEIVKECFALVRIVNVNSAALVLHEADSKEALYEGVPKTFIPETYEAFRRGLIAIAQGNTELLFDAKVETLRGNRRDVSISFSVCPGYEQSLSKVFVSLFDITQRKQDEDQLRLAASVFSNSHEGIMISDAGNRIIDVNPAFTRLTGYRREEALGQNPNFLSSGRQDQDFYADMWRTIKTKGNWQGELWNRRKSGEIYPELLSIVAVQDGKGRLQHYVGAFSDISMIKQHQEDLDRIAHYDMLTSLPNRRLLRDRLEHAIAHTKRHGKNLAVCYLDLDGFKPINDQFGHECGDRILIEIARRLESMSRAEDTVARLGGDEFVLLWNEIDTKSDCTHALDRMLEKIAKPINMSGEMVVVSASIGVTLYPDDFFDADSLLRHADHAMYTAKQLGKNRYQFFDSRIEQQITSRLELLNRVESSLESGQFELYYQPKINCITGEVDSLEALLRWNDPANGLVGPKEFLSHIENDNLELRLGRWVIEQAIQQAKVWNDLGITLPISINVFPRHLKYITFNEDILNAITTHWPDLPKGRLQIEIVETAALDELEPIEDVITTCKEVGIGFSLDDFGTGYSSLVYLHKLSIDELKIDQSFVRDMLVDKNDEAIVISIIGLGKAFGLRVVAEGVESKQQARHLVNLGCKIAQGFGLGRPMPPRAFDKWYASYSMKKS